MKKINHKFLREYKKRRKLYNKYLGNIKNLEKQKRKQISFESFEEFGCLLLFFAGFFAFFKLTDYLNIVFNRGYGLIVGILLYLTMVFLLWLLESDFLKNIITLGKFGKIKRYNGIIDRKINEIESQKNVAAEELRLYEKNITEYYEEYIEDYFLQNLYRKRISSLHYRTSLEKLSEIIEEIKEVNRTLILEQCYINKYQDYLAKKELRILLYGSNNNGKNNSDNKLSRYTSVGKNLILAAKKITEDPPEKKYFTPKKINWEEINKTKVRIGNIGENVVFEIEKEYLSGIGRDDLSKKVCNISKEKGDGAGYDILSFFENGEEKYIEVKSTKNIYVSSFNISKNELDFLQTHSDNSFVYLVSGIDSDDLKLKVISIDEIVNSKEIVATQFVVKI